MEEWYTLYTRPRMEHRVAVTLDDQGIKTYLPKIKDHKEPSKGKLLPLFPCYLFMWVDLERTVAAQWQWAPGLRCIVAFDGEALPVSEQGIELIRRNIDEFNSSLAWHQSKFKPGDVVRVTTGPFAELLALFEGPTTPAKRVTVLLSFLGNLNRVRLNANYLEKAPPGMEVTLPKRPRQTRGNGRRI
jgi:transcriptional antiterminator RfaH